MLRNSNIYICNSKKSAQCNRKIWIYIAKEDFNLKLYELNKLWKWICTHAIKKTQNQYKEYIILPCVIVIHVYR